MPGVFTDSDYYRGPPLTSAMVQRAETALGVRLPGGYLELLSENNGGTFAKRFIATSFPTSWAADHFAVSGLLGIGGERGIDSTTGLGSVDLIAEWGYPDVGIVICDTPSAGHDTVMLDYSACGPLGEPTVVYVDEDRVSRQVADAFIALLADCEVIGG